MRNHNDCIPHKPTNFVWYIGLENENVRYKHKEILDKKMSDFNDVVYNYNTNLNQPFHKEQLIYGFKRLLLSSFKDYKRSTSHQSS